MNKQKKAVITFNYIKYIETGDEKYFNYIYNNLYNILKEKFIGNKIFSDISFEHTFDDIYQLTIIKVFTHKDKFDVNKGNVVTWAYTIFKNTLIDEKRKIKMIKVKLNENKLFLD